MQSSLRTLSVITVIYFSFALCMSLETNSIRSIIHHQKQNDTQQQNRTQNNNNVPVLLDNILDVRTPPKVQNQIKDKLSSKYALESSHAGVAIPVLHDLMEDAVLEESSTKKANYYKLERPTTPTAGLSTWILLNSPTTVTSSAKPLSTKKTNIKPIIIKDDKNNETLMLSEHDKPSIKMAKPVFKPRNTTPKPVIIANISTNAVITTTTEKINSFSSSSSSSSTRKPPAKLTKIKASLLQNFNNSNKLKNNSTISTTITSSTTNAPKLFTTNAPKILTTTTPKMILINTTEPSNAALSAEAKITEQELPSSSSENSKKKKKKNKKKRNKPSKSKEGNQKLKESESSPGTQLYSYFRSEIIPVTVGVSLVGLLVTAGLAGYYFTPFAALRRSDPIIDRKDTEGSYYYQHHDTYSNAMPEEEALDKFIAGMPNNGNHNLQDTMHHHQQPSSSLSNRNSQNIRYRHVDRRSQIYMNPHGSVEDVKLNDRAASSVNYNYDKKFVVGSIPEETIQEVTPAVVPEHGPRNLQENRRKFVMGNIPVDLFSRGASPRKMMAIRKKRAMPINYEENEILSEITGVKNLEESTITTSNEETTLTTDLITTEKTDPKETTPTNIFNPITERPHHNNTVIELLTDLFKLKLKLGFDLFRNFTNTVSNYVRTVHTRLDEHYRRSVNNKKNQA